MAKSISYGDCYVCGKTLGKVAMKNHALKEHSNDGDEKCLMLKIEGLHSKSHWLLVDIAKTRTLKSLDTFLRQIWLECCGHLSAFGTYYNDEESMHSKLGGFHISDEIVHTYDFGSSTRCLITVVGETVRKEQKDAVRLIARNVPPVYKCSSCDMPAALICQYDMFEYENPFFCSNCAEKLEDDIELLNITNSPRNGVCGYSGELDKYRFDRSALGSANQLQSR